MLDQSALIPLTNTYVFLSSENVMKIIKGADRGRTEWTARKLVEFVEDGTVNFNIDIQRGYVWKENCE